MDKAKVQQWRCVLGYHERCKDSEIEYFFSQKKSFLKRFSKNHAQTSGVHGQMWITSSKRSIFREMRQQWRGAPAPNLPGPARTECQEEDSTSAFRLRHRNKTNTTSRLLLRYCRRECPPKSTIWVESQFGEPQCAHLRSKTTEDREGRTWTWLVVCGSFGAVCSKTLIIVSTISFSVPKRKC